MWIKETPLAERTRAPLEAILARLGGEQAPTGSLLK